MTAILYPVAANAEAALSGPLGRAAREREARRMAGEAVRFVTEAAGPAFSSREAALDAYAGRVEDDRPGKPAIPAEDRYLRLVELLAPEVRRVAPVKPAFAKGRRWPDPKPAPATVWRLQIAYWRLASDPDFADTPQAREARRQAEAAALPAEALRAIARQPLRPVKPQQPLDIGLFETRLPEAPHIVVPDE